VNPDDDEPEMSEESEDSTDEDEDASGLVQAHTDIDNIVKTPKSQSFKVADFLLLGYEKDMGRIELPWYT